ncbi:hypothetical protein C1H46_034300 [Malus baccata]|uniref:Uncharacterized protein n=1 Tax=Malus baccata TaxID=106549 RepID=A0A540L121_MALBA|nr:hypothetical protein C1H46_034300 [Malus baccata]
MHNAFLFCCLPVGWKPHIQNDPRQAGSLSSSCSFCKNKFITPYSRIKDSSN